MAVGYAEERVAEVEKAFDTRLGPEEIYEAIQRSAEAAKVAAGGGKLKELALQDQEDGSDAVYFAVLMGIGVERGRIAVRWWPDRPGCHRAKVHIISYDTGQVAPLAPKTVPILRCVRRFVDALEVELRRDTAEGAATRTGTSTKGASVASEPTDEETERILELVERGMSGGLLSDAELRELKAAGITAVFEPGRSLDERARTSRPASGANPSMAEARRRLVEEGFIDESAQGPAEQGPGETERPAKADPPHAPPIVIDDRSAEDDVARCASCGSEARDSDRFCRKCGAELGAERPAARHRAMDGDELDAVLLKAQRKQAAGILVQAASLTTDQVNRILQEAEHAGPAFDNARDRAVQSATPGEFLAVGYCFRRIRDLVLPERLPGGRLEGISKADEATVATMGSGAALGYLKAKPLLHVDLHALVGPWLRAVGEPPPGDDLVELAIADKPSQQAAESSQVTNGDEFDTAHYRRFNPVVERQAAGLWCPSCGDEYSFGQSCIDCGVTLVSTQEPRQRHARQPASRAAAQSARPSPRYVSDAQIGENFTVRQVLDGLCWMIAGIAAVVFGTQPEFSSGWVIAGGLAAVVYGLRVLFGGGSYWVSNVVYLIAILSVAAAFGAVF